MTQQDKQLLLKDLCARLPYGVVVNFNDGVHCINEKLWSIEMDCGTFNCGDWICNNTKPFLRPIESMTEEECKEYYSMYSMVNEEHVEACEIIDWLNNKMFDYRGLISKGLAIAVTQENNPYKAMEE